MAQRAEYPGCFEAFIMAGMRSGVFTVASLRLSAYAVLDLGMGVAVWYREGSGPRENAMTWQYAEFALRIVGAEPKTLPATIASKTT